MLHTEESHGPPMKIVEMILVVGMGWGVRRKGKSGPGIVLP